MTIERVLLALPIDANVFMLRCNRRRPETLARSIVAFQSDRRPRRSMQSTRVKNLKKKSRLEAALSVVGNKEDGSSVVSRCTPAFYPTAWSTDSQRCARVAKRCWAPPSAELLCVPASKSPLYPALLTVCCHLHSNSHGFCLSVVDTNRSTCSLCTRAMNRQHTTSQTIFFVFSTAFPVLPSVLHVFFSDASLSPACLTDPARWSRCPTTSSADG